MTCINVYFLHIDTNNVHRGAGVVQKRFGHIAAHKIIYMKSIIMNLLFDLELVNGARKANVDKNQLYNELVQGRITLQEYLQMV